jgi:hypothetical protein
LRGYNLVYIPGDLFWNLFINNLNIYIMRFLKNSLLLFLIPFLVTSCINNPGSNGSAINSSLPNVTGSSGEVLVVMDNNLWKSDGGNALREALEQEYPALPQPEPLFDVIHITSGAFDDLFKMHRSIIITDVSPVNKIAEIKYFENSWARPQIVIRILAPDPEALKELIKENVEPLITNLQKYDRQRLSDLYKSTRDVGIKNLLAKFGIEMSVPRGYNIDINTDEFISLSIETSQTSQVLFIYKYPYFDQNNFTTPRLIEKRNEFLKKYTVGSRAGSYMTTASLFPPIVYDLKVNGNNIVEIRGLWELNKGFMGGPFISHSTLDSLNNKVVTVEGYVYNPNNKKRNLMRQMEAIVYSFELLK